MIAAPKRQDRRASTFKWTRLGPLFALAAVCLAGGDSLHAQQRIATGATSNKWETLEHCRLLEKGWRDGDSFHVRHKDREYVFRLYFVDAPEADAENAERLDDQATFFGLSRSQTVELGHEASKFTGHQLSGDFTVTTRWENGGGKGSLARFYGIVVVNGKNLSAELVRNGLARIHGKTVKWPDDPRSTEFMSELRKLELDAREQRRGAWNETRYPRSAATRASENWRRSPESDERLPNSSYRSDRTAKLETC